MCTGRMLKDTNIPNSALETIYVVTRHIWLHQLQYVSKMEHHHRDMSEQELLTHGSSQARLNKLKQKWI
jgi:hypothetical protein